VSPEAERFDGPRFDQRAGLGGEASRAVARAVLDLVSPRAEDVLLEIGAGTGEIGQHLVGRVAYVGIDRSRGMLDEFRARLAVGAAGECLVVQADAEQGWPVRPGAAAAVLAARVAHLLDPGLLAAEVVRVCRGGALFLIGRVQRDPASVQSRLRTRREALLRDRGLVPGSGARAGRELLDRLVAGGAARLPTTTAATWTAHTSAERVLHEWANLPTMGGVPVAADVRHDVLRELREWAGAELGELPRPVAHTERFDLDGVRLPPTRDTGPGSVPGRDLAGETWTIRC
jgi:SAM-dependent methyltransferase